MSRYSKQANPELDIPFLQALGQKRCPFWGMDMARPVKAKSVDYGIPDGRSGWPLRREVSKPQ